MNSEKPRLTTMLFADIDDHQRLLKKCPTDQVDCAFRAFEEVCKEIVRTHGPDDYLQIGDGFLFFFRADTSQDEAEQCVNAAFGLLDKIRPLNRENRITGGKIRVSAAIHRGEIPCKIATNVIHAAPLNELFAFQKRFALPEDLTITSEVYQCLGGKPRSEFVEAIEKHEGKPYYVASPEQEDSLHAIWDGDVSTLPIKLNHAVRYPQLVMASLMIAHLARKDWDSDRILAMSVGGAVIAALVSKRLDVPMYVVPRRNPKKQETDAGKSEPILGGLLGAACHRKLFHRRRVLIVDDMIRSGSTLVAGKALAHRGGASAVNTAVILLTKEHSDSHDGGDPSYPDLACYMAEGPGLRCIYDWCLIKDK